MSDHFIVRPRTSGIIWEKKSVFELTQSNLSDV